MKSLRAQFQPDANFAFVEFGLSEEEFFRQTPRQWQGRFKAWQQKEERADRRVARLCWIVARAIGGNDDLTENDFIPSKPDEKEQTEDEMVSVLGFLGAKIQHG